jgi:hypothetical protein
VRLSPPAAVSTLLSTSLALTSAVAFAQARPVVVLREVKPAPSPALEASLREMLDRLSVNLDTTAMDGGAPALAIVDVDFAARAVVVDSPGRALTVRRGLPESAEGQVASEAAATLIASAVDVLVHTDPPRQPVRPTPEVPAVVQAPVPKPKLSPVGLDLGVGLGARLAGGTSVVDFGASVHVLATLPLGSQLPGLLATVAFQPGFDLTDEVVSLRGSVLSARLFAQLEVLRWRWGRLEAGAGGGFDRFAFTPLQREGELLRPMAGRVALAPMVGGVLTWRVPVGESVHLFTTLTVDGDLRPPPPMRGMPGEQNDPRPWAVRPMLQLGVSFAPLRARE